MEFVFSPLSELHILENNGQYVIVSDFFNLLKRYHKPTDKPLKYFNFARELKGEIKIINEKDVICVQGLLRYIFIHRNDFFICTHIATKLQNIVISNKTTDKSIKVLYDTINESSIIENFVCDADFENISLEESNILSLSSIYKEHYTEKEWKKICMFEHHFMTSSSIDICEYTYEDLLEKKLNYLQDLLKLKNLTETIQKISKQKAKSRNDRKLAGEERDGIKLKARYLHIPHTLEDDLLKNIPETAQCSEIICVDCVPSCRHPAAIHVYTETKSNDHENNINIAKLCVFRLLKIHMEETAEVVFFGNGCENYFGSDKNEKKRFQMRDDYLLFKLAKFCTYRWQNEEVTHHENVPPLNFQQCKHCFGDSLIKPLHMKTFDILQEWYLDTPLECQIFLGQFINTRSIKETTRKDELLKTKLKRLYHVYDILLNISNKKYSGIYQDINTQELALNYHSVNSVFNVTSSFGVTQSLKTAEEKMKDRASSEQCYFNTYLKMFPVTYESEAGLVTREVNLRDCVIILLLDNLVRLRYHADPDPGEGRCLQLCTLPITLKGIPTDSSEVIGWHCDECDGLQSCNCKTDRSLSKEDLDHLVLKLSEDEAILMEKYKKLTAYGCTAVWKTIYDENMLGTVHLDTEDDLEKSFSSMVLHVSSDDEQSGSLFQNDDGLSNLTLEIDRIEVTEMQPDFDLIQYDTDDLNNIADLDIENISAVRGTFENESSSIQNSVIDSLVTESDEGTNSNLYAALQDENEMNSFIQSLGFEPHRLPKMITRHPPPVTGRDDDISKLQEVLDDILIKTDLEGRKSGMKILFAPDNKIGANLFKLREKRQKYHQFLAEFPVLHLRKSKITILISAYKDAGLLHIFKYMRDDEFSEWKKLLSVEHIDMATKYIRRLAVGLQVAFICKFLQSRTSAEHDIKSIISMQISEEFWAEYHDFMKKGENNNGTFALHVEIMRHCEEICAIAFAERLGGAEGYSLLLAAVKQSLPFSFMNGASSYAAFTMQLLQEHYKSGPFFQNMKKSLFTTPNKESTVNFALDAQREMDHRDVMKAFRSGSSVASIIPRMSLIDSLNEISDINSDTMQSEEKSLHSLLGLKLTLVDVKYIMRLVGLLLRQGGLSDAEDKTTYNVYDPKKIPLPDAILDSRTAEIGEFLVRKYAARTGLFGYTQKDEPEVETLSGPKDLLQKLKRSKATTIRRVGMNIHQKNKSARDKNEEQRKKMVRQEAKRIDCLSSAMNACQAIVKPDCSKPKVLKSSGMKSALETVLRNSLEILNLTESEHQGSILENLNLIFTGKTSVPESISKEIKFATVEFAGIKFKAQVSSGQQYMKYIESNIIKRSLILFPNLTEMVICEEKYSFTPDDFKAATRSQRKRKEPFAISHLKTKEEIISSDKFDKTCVTSTAEGKTLVSTYLGRNLNNLSIKANLSLIIDSECHLADSKQTGKKYAIPVKAVFSKQNGLEHTESVSEIMQCKGEAEMAQIDWLYEYIKNRNQTSESLISIVSSGDIDSVILHLFGLFSRWPRTDRNKFKNPVYVLLQKPGGKMDIYNMTAIIELLEAAWGDRFIAAKVSLALSLGGNDYLPKFYSISHTAVVLTFLKDRKFKDSLFQLEDNDENKIDADIYVDFVKALYTPKKLDYQHFSYTDIQHMSMFATKPEKRMRNPQNWLPPESAVRQLAKNVNCLIKYYQSIGKSDDELPNFLQDGCLRKLPCGDIEYDLGPESQLSDSLELFHLQSSICGGKRKKAKTPQKGRRRKKQITSTPRKSDDLQSSNDGASSKARKHAITMIHNTEV